MEGLAAKLARGCGRRRRVKRLPSLGLRGRWRLDGCEQTRGNAFLTVMATLVWWAEGLKDCAQDAGWVAAVEEVVWVLDQMVSRFVSARGLYTGGADRQCSQAAPSN